jgi:transcriptional regulator with XRE-family HTH domain
MKYLIRELRESTGLSQNAFAEKIGIPVSTLRKWEIGAASPPDYVIQLIARALPATQEGMRRIPGNNGKVYYYDSVQQKVLDQQGNSIKVTDSLDGVSEQNLVIYLEDLFEEFYHIQDKFNRDLQYDRMEKITWSRENIS